MNLRRIGPYNEEDGSIRRMLSKLPASVRSLFYRNKRRSDVEARLMNDWADRGFVSGNEDDVSRWEDEGGYAPPDEEREDG